MIKSVTDGSPSDSAFNGLGWIFLQDLQYTAESPLLLPAGTRMKVPNNSMGLLTQRSFAPATASNWYDPQTSTFHPDDLGDVFLYRLNLALVPTVNFRTATVDFNIGTPNNPFETNIFMAKGAGIPTRVSLPIPIAASSGFVNNGGSLNIQADCDISIYKITLHIQKTYKYPGSLS